jgi:hypothetical protein
MGQARRLRKDYRMGAPTGTLVLTRSGGHPTVRGVRPLEGSPHGGKADVPVRVPS